MFQSSTVYSVQYSRANEAWTVYVDGRAVVKKESRDLSTNRYEHYEYDKKKDAVEKARELAKGDANREHAQKPVQLKVYNKSGSKTTEVSNYGV